MTAPRGSIAWRLQLGFALASMLVVALMALAAERSLLAALDNEDAIVLRGQASVLLDDLGGDLDHDDLLADHPEKAQWRLVDGAGPTLAQSRGMAAVVGVPWPAVDGMPEEVTGSDERPYTVLTASRSTPGGRLRIQLALDRSHETGRIHRYRLTLGLATLVAALVEMGLGRIMAVRALAPLHRIQAEAGSVGPGALDRRLDATGYPTELRGLAEGLNQTFARLDTTFRRLSELSSDLAHELRTPLQNVRAEIEGLLLRAADTGPMHDARPTTRWSACSRKWTG